MKSNFLQKVTYKIVSNIVILPIYKLIFRGSLIGKQNIPKIESFILVSNHGSLLDPPLLGHAIGRNISFMAKAELFKIPLLGFIIKACGAYPVKRGIVDKNTIKTACNKLLKNQSIGIFIDGTRQKDGRVNKPKQGAALLSSKNQKMLLPVAIVNTHKLVRFKYFVPFFSRVIIKVGKPIPPPKSSSKEELLLLTKHIQDSINNMLV